MLFRRKKYEAIDAQIDAVHESMKTYGPDTPEYPGFVTHLERLQELKTTKNRREPLNVNTVITTVGTIVLSVIIVIHEREHVWTSKATTFLTRPPKD